MENNYNRQIDRRKIFQLNFLSQRFQLRYAFWLASIGMFNIFLMCWFMVLTIRRSLEDIPQISNYREIIVNTITLKNILIRYEILIPLIIIVGFLFAIGIVGTNRIAGPLHTIKTHLKGLSDGSIKNTKINIRATDELHDLIFLLNNNLKHHWLQYQKVDQLLVETENLLANREIEHAKNKISLARLVLKDK